MDDGEAIQPKDKFAWREWLDSNHAKSPGVWLIIYKKSSGKQTLSFDQAIEEALCYGWIDSKPGKVDKERTKLWFAPRKPKTGWSKLNKTRVMRLVSEGRMMVPGQFLMQSNRLRYRRIWQSCLMNIPVPARTSMHFRACKKRNPVGGRASEAR